MALDWTTFLLVVMLFLLPVLFFVSRSFKFYTKVTVHYLNIFLASLLPIPLACFRPKNPLNTNFCGFVLRRLSKFFFEISWEVRGQENLKDEDSAIVVCNHQSSLDVIAMMEMWPRLHRCVPAVKRELLFAGPFGLMAWLSGAIFLDRGNSTKARSALNDSLHKLKQDKVKLWVFPEGTRNNKGSMLPFKKGAFHLAIQAQIPIMPLVISPYSDFYDKSTRKFDRGGKAIIKVLPPVPTKGLTVNDIDDLIERVRNQMMTTLDELIQLKSDCNNHIDSNHVDK